LLGAATLALAVPAGAQDAQAPAVPSPAAAAATGQPPVPGAKQQAQPAEEPLVAMPSQAPGNVTAVEQKIGEAQSQVGARLSSVGLSQGGTGLESVDTSTYRSDLDALTAQQREKQKLQNMLEQAQLLAKLMSVLQDPKAKDADAARAIAAAQPSQPQVVPAVAPAKPMVVSIGGTGAAPAATILVPGVGEVVAVPGSVLPGGMKVISVGQSGVVVQSGGKRQTLAFGTATAPTAPTPVRR
jgi:type IV pilus biogenesis protein PilP